MTKLKIGSIFPMEIGDKRKWKDRDVTFRVTGFDFYVDGRSPNKLCHIIELDTKSKFSLDFDEVLKYSTPILKKTRKKKHEDSCITNTND